MSPIRILNPKEDKAERERKIFERFVLAARPDIDHATIESRAPPEPDIRCSAADGPLAFELVELCPEDFAKAVSGELKQGGGVISVDFSDPTRATVKKKLAKKYKSDVPIDLLCYADGFLVTLDDLVIEEIHAALNAQGCSQLRQIWLHGVDGVHRVV